MAITTFDDRFRQQDDDEWQEVRGRNGQIWELNARTGETRQPAVIDDLTPEMRQAEALLPAIQQPSITTPDGRRITPHQWLTEQGLKTDMQSLVTIRTFAREASEIRNEGRPLGRLWVNVDNWQTDRQTGKAFRTVRDASLSEITTINEGRRTLLMHIADAMAEGTKFDLEEVQLTREDLRRAREEKARREQVIFEREHLSEAYERRHELERMKVQGQIDVEKIKAQAEVASASEARAQSYALQQSVLNRTGEINQLINELQYLYSNDPNTAVLQMLTSLREVAKAANELTGTDEALRSQAEAKLIKQNIPWILSEAQNMLAQQRAQAMQQTRKKPEVRRKDGGA